MAFNRKYTEKELNISNIHLHNLPERKFQNGKKWNFRKFQNVLKERFSLESTPDRFLFVFHSVT